ncbi:MAG: hypothetical protein AAFN44_03430 [Pseudomonadota bacterium]
MNVMAIQDKLLARLQSMPGRPPIAYPNGPLVKDLPRIVVQYVPSAQRPFDMSGQTQVDAEINARIEVEQHTTTKKVGTIVAAIQDHFRPTTRFDDVTIMQAPDPRPAIPGQGVYAVPVIIRGRADF